jgi:preprotein translocase subunit Sss1
MAKKELQPQPKEFADWAVPALVILLGLGILGGGGYLVYKWIWGKKPDPVYSKIESIKRVQELHLAKLHFESIIPITKENRRSEKFQFLLIAPMELSMYVDMKKVDFQPMGDSMLQVTIPQPEISEVYIDFRKTKEYNYSDPGIMAKITGREKFDYMKVVQEVQQKIRAGKKQVIARANSPAVMQDVVDKAEAYLQNVLNSVGYRVSFVEPELQNQQQKLLGELESLLEDNDEIDESKLYKKLVKLVIKSK